MLREQHERERHLLLKSHVFSIPDNPIFHFRYVRAHDVIREHENK